MSNYYLWRNEKEDGPYPLDDVREMVKAGAVTNETLFCEERGEKWRPVKEWPAFYEEPRKQVWVAEARQEAASARQPTIEPAGRRPSSMELELSVKGGRFVLAAKIAWVAGGCCLFGGFVDAIGSDYKSGEGAYVAGGGFLGLGMWLYLGGQVILARAAIERKN